ncbi:hypothetical protein [Paenibacillus methanolicus]|uniref:IDEAL domain-containing protein n=1 Tax=Paenibacillus methanolicus TaxID=582686 RepID=A0A5S5BVG1_9BACL|nr:hypothetical protein [Paenibacillus methanolicus]TYP70172.1 hypothetical protein BCM02_112152 [Paenibacillus methanolicus]
MRFEMSDWVQGRAENGELIQGFIVAIHEAEAALKVHVVQSDNEAVVGKGLMMREQWLKDMPFAETEDAGQIADLVDLALATQDVAWFEELSARLKQGARQDAPSGGRAGFRATRNRLDLPRYQ